MSGYQDEYNTGRAIGYNKHAGKSTMVMNLKETIISSLFFHLILFLLMIAVSSYTTGFSGDIPNIIAVSLTMDGSKDLPSAGSDSADEPLLVSRPLSNEEVSLPDQAANKPPEESEKIPEPEKKAEAITDPAKIEKKEKPPAQRGGFTSLEDYYRFIIVHKKIFGEKAGARINELLGEAFKVNKRVFYGGTAIVNVTFGSDRKLSGVVVDSASPELKAFLEEIGWDAVPAPAAYLGNSVQIEFTVLEGYMSFKVNTL
ncbi:MAG: hypothetical protein WA610_11505 [Thermodesulfovibrionales bacterium]